MVRGATNFTARPNFLPPYKGIGRHWEFLEIVRPLARTYHVRLPVLSLLAGSVVSYVGASSPVVSCGFWNRCARPPCGRLRRLLSGLHFPDLPLPCGEVRKKESVTAHLPKGILGHRRQKAVTPLMEPLKMAA